MMGRNLLRGGRSTPASGIGIGIGPGRGGVRWRLSAGAGKKTVYAQFRESASNVSAIVLDTIKYRRS